MNMVLNETIVSVVVFTMVLNGQTFLEVGHGLEPWHGWCWGSQAHPNLRGLFEVTDKLCAAAIQLTDNHQEANEIARAVMDAAKWWP
jgi:hypothetical protein